MIVRALRRYSQLHRKFRSEETNQLNCRSVIVIVGRKIQIVQKIICQRVRKVSAIKLKPSND